MLKNYLKSAHRNLFNSRSFSIINILGLAVSMTACLFIMQYVTYELSYDKFYEGHEKIYRVAVDKYQNQEPELSNAFTVPALGPAVKEKVPGVTGYFRLHSFSDSYVISSQEDGTKRKVFTERGVFFADPAIIRHLSLSVMPANNDQILAEPGNVIVSQSVAKKFFGEDALKRGDLLGKNLSLDGNGMQTLVLTVKGVFDDFQDNSHLDFDFLISHRSITDLYIPPGEMPEEERLSIIDNSWGPPQWYTYIVLNPRTDPAGVAEKITGLVRKRNKLEHTYEKYYLQPVSSIHLYSNLKNEPSINGNINNVKFMAVIAVITLFIAWINYVNLSMARMLERAREVGLRKVAGASKAQLLGQFLFESLILNILALLVAFVSFFLALPYFEAITGTKYTVFFPGSVAIIFLAFLAFALGGLIAGVYPALTLSRCNPVLVLKGKLISHGKGRTLRKLLVTFQFSLSIAMMVGTIAIYRQNEFMRTEELGMNIDRTLVVKSPDILPSGTRSFQGALDIFRNEIDKYRWVENVASTSVVPGRLESGGEHIKRFGNDDLDTREIKVITIDHAYFDNLDIEVIEGRNFQKNSESNKGKIILNESALSYLGFTEDEQVVGSKLNIARYSGFNEYEIIGIVSDFHQTSLKNKIEPLAFYSFPSPGYYLIKLNPGEDPGGNVRESISQVEKTFKALFPGNPFEYFFLDDFFDRQYRADLRFGKIFGVFAILALFIAGLGLFGLSFLTVIRRTREIGVRKTFGASVRQIFGLLTMDFIKLVILANLIAMPLVFWAIREWLTSYPFRTSLEWWFFAAPAVAILTLALLTVGFQTFKAALTNPVEALRHE